MCAGTHGAILGGRVLGIEGAVIPMEELKNGSKEFWGEFHTALS